MFNNQAVNAVSLEVAFVLVAREQAKREFNRASEITEETANQLCNAESILTSRMRAYYDLMERC